MDGGAGGRVAGRSYNFTFPGRRAPAATHHFAGIPLPSAPANRVRIIGGAWRGRVVRFPAVAGPAARRPTASAKRCSTGSGQELTGKRCLELYAGTGVLSLEALSRGAALAVAVDRSRALIDALRATAQALGAAALETHCADARAFLAAERRDFDVIFLDPPFGDDPWAWLLPACAARLAPGGFVYAEAGHALDAAAAARCRGAATRRGRCIIIFSPCRSRRRNAARAPPPVDPCSRRTTRPAPPCSRSSTPARSIRSPAATRTSCAAPRGCSTGSSSASPTASRSGRSSPTAERVAMAREVLSPFANVEVAPFSSLLMDFVHDAEGAGDPARPARGVRLRVRVPDGRDEPQPAIRRSKRCS